MEHHIQNFKAKAYYKAPNDQCSINTCQEKVDILEETMDAERENGQQKMHYLEEELSEIGMKSTDTFSETRFDACRQMDEMEDTVSVDLRRQKRRGGLFVDRQQRYLLRIKRSWIRCSDLPLKL